MSDELGSGRDPDGVAGEGNDTLMEGNWNLQRRHKELVQENLAEKRKLEALTKQLRAKLAMLAQQPSLPGLLDPPAKLDHDGLPENKSVCYEDFGSMLFGFPSSVSPHWQFDGQFSDKALEDLILQGNHARDPPLDVVLAEDSPQMDDERNPSEQESHPEDLVSELDLQEMMKRS